MPEFHASLDAALARNSGPSAEDVDARDLSDVVHDFLGAACDATDLDVPPCWTLAQRILASDWLAAHTAAAEARGAERERALRRQFYDEGVKDGIQLAARLVRDHVLGETGGRVADFLLARAAREAAARVEGGA